MPSKQGKYQLHIRRATFKQGKAITYLSISQHPTQMIQQTLRSIQSYQSQSLFKSTLEYIHIKFNTPTHLQSRCWCLPQQNLRIISSASILMMVMVISTLALYQLLGFNLMSSKQSLSVKGKSKNCKILHFHWLLRLHSFQQTISILTLMNLLAWVLYLHQ